MILPNRTMVRWTRVHTAVLCLCLSGLVGLIAAPAVARTVFPAQGGAGEIHNAVECDKGEYIVGFKGRVGAWIDRLTPLCAPLLDKKHNLDMGSAKSKGTFGGSGGSPAEVECGDTLITGIQFSLTNDNRMVYEILFGCSVLHDNGTTAVIEARGEKRFGGVGPRLNVLIKNECPAGEAATGIQANWGQHVNAIGLICGAIRIPKDKDEGGSSKAFVVVAGDQKGHWALSVGYPAKADAVAAAMKTCGTGCKILHENQAKCVAVAESQQSHAVWGITSANTLIDAENGALQACSKQAPGQCKLVDGSRCS
jgi:hypothetical protein